MAHKQVRVRYNRTMGIGKDKRSAGFETMLDAATAEKWAANGRVSIISSGREKGRATPENPTLAPQAGSPAGLGAVSSSSHLARPQTTATSKRRGRPPKAKLPVIDPFG